MPSPESYQLLLAAAAACEDKKAEDIRILALDPSESGLTDHFLICNGTNDRQNVAISDEIEIRLKREFGTYPNSVEGRRQAEWILMDYVDFIVHVFSPEKRAFYGLERLRKSATSLSVDELNAEFKASLAKPRKTAAKQASGATENETSGGTSDKTSRTRKTASKSAKKTASRATRKTSSKGAAAGSSTGRAQKRPRRRRVRRHAARVSAEPLSRCDGCSWAARLRHWPQLPLRTENKTAEALGLRRLLEKCGLEDQLCGKLQGTGVVEEVLLRFVEGRPAYCLKRMHVVSCSVFTTSMEPWDVLCVVRAR